MKNFIKTLAIIFCFVVPFSLLVGCGDARKNSSSDGSSNGEITQPDNGETEQTNTVENNIVMEFSAIKLLLTNASDVTTLTNVRNYFATTFNSISIDNVVSILNMYKEDNCPNSKTYTIDSKNIIVTKTDTTLELKIDEDNIILFTFDGVNVTNIEGNNFNSISQFMKNNELFITYEDIEVGSRYLIKISNTSIVLYSETTEEANIETIDSILGSLEVVLTVNF